MNHRISPRRKRVYRMKLKQKTLPPLRWRIFKAVMGALVIWAGETAVGLIPLATHFIVATYSRVQSHDSLTTPGPHGASLPLAEMNILAVVISGLGLLSLLGFGRQGRQVRLTPMSYLAGLCCLLLLIASSVLYALEAAEIGTGSENITQYVLGFAVLISLFLALEPAWLEAVNDT